MKNDDDSEGFDAACLALGQIQAEDDPEARLRKESRIHADAKIGARRSYQQYLENGRRQKEAAVTIQSAIRGWQARTEFLAQKSAATKLQALARGLIGRREFEKTKQATLTLQSAVRAHQAQQELKRLKDERDTAFQELRDHVESSRLKLHPKIINCTTHFPCDSLLVNLAALFFTEPIDTLDLYIQKGELAGYRATLREIKLHFDESRHVLVQRVADNLAIYNELKKLAEKAGVTVFALDVKLPQTNLKRGWSDLKDLCSANPRNLGDIFDLVGKITLHYEEPKVEKKALPKFDRENSNTWDLQPVKWAPELAVLKTTIEGIPQFSTRLDALKTGSLSGRTITKGAVKKTGFVMHEHISGNCGLGFCYVHNGGNSVTPWIVDYASDRWQGNGYDWTRSGKKKGDPLQDLLPKADV